MVFTESYQSTYGTNPPKPKAAPYKPAIGGFNISLPNLYSPAPTTGPNFTPVPGPVQNSSAIPSSFSPPVVPQVKPVVQKPATPITPNLPQNNNTSYVSEMVPPPGSPQVPQAPQNQQMNLQTQKAFDAANNAYAESLKISPDELSTQEDLDKLIESTKKGYLNTEGQPIAMDFITGQLAAIEKRATSLAEPLEKKLARLQAARQSSLESSKFALEQADKKLAEEKAKYAPKEINPGSSLVAFNPATGKYEEQFKAPEKVTKPSSVQEYEYAAAHGYKGTYQQYQNEDANRKAKATGSGQDLNALLSVTEAQALGVPYGTTRLQALGSGVTGKPTAEQSKARQFATAADNANSVLNTSTYDLGFIENPWMPNAFKGEKRQEFEQAARSFVNAVLRRESGATITDSEFSNKYKELIPQAGDSTGVKAQKQSARISAVNSIREAGGDQVGASSSSGSTYKSPISGAAYQLPY